MASGGVLARYGREGVETYVITATRGDAGRRGRGLPSGEEPVALIRERELRAAAGVLGVKEVRVLGYGDGKLDQADAGEVVRNIAGHLRRIRPHVVLTFGPDGAYGHPDHIAISQFTTAAVMAAADGTVPTGSPLPPHQVSKLYYLAWTAEAWRTFQETFKPLVSLVDGVERGVTPWPEWAITTRVDCRECWRQVWDAVKCHRTQVSIYEPFERIGESLHRRLWGDQTWYRVFSTVNGGRAVETDLFEGLRKAQSLREAV
jgi:LmbE family N-acetylglucosaminyl deacetylase